MTLISENFCWINHPEFSSGDPLLDKTAGLFASLMTGQIPDRQTADYLPINGGAVSAPAEASLLLQYGLTDHEDSLLSDSDLNLIPESLLEMLRCADEMRIIDARRKIFDDSRRIKELEAEKAQVVQSRIDAVLTFFAQQKPLHIPENSGHPPDERTALLARLLQPEIRTNRANTDTALRGGRTLLFSREEIDDTARKTAAVSASAMAELDLLERQTDRLRREKSSLNTSLTDLIRLNRLLKENQSIIYHYFFKKEKRQILDNMPPLSDESRNLFQLAGLCAFIQGVLYRKFTPSNKLPRSIDLKKTAKNMLAYACPGTSSKPQGD
ncbi:hypothetical protein A3J20_03455 [Candidatus Gottesmanbacteria bacterium RIFCSPLOWO2_02_FULL_42_29]|uniref:Uncharacterized protein n=2 Tax=Candidatus Gottesmaniibacteriota TaxID=1752720 RepID=A0A1F6BEV7_9BACT|nr:MAG: hypothetical protein UV09_C0002G0056 [Candidatus Gottesmanbacteria bacterium GW2011_GWA2_42_18]OGG12232.1 MAG: hypothetical protein A2781_04935 [Candidatus Gottesmanbacteria bacterium RIFCSPHIGHO2_01_FULL_42_27]OGG21720.1 MAG: hypothetical protein A3E72_04600 [Candidatus Gottesmanbacteria bacterium RIFCSPHIGHO2_12_FULL_43_26]OGG34719.1 MAG: hypothetical protein A3G68_01625 [Candidatus Gottesmanbacteria bacterium RIFCSPLOWO2_12_FULL_42_10]OGG35057.1 MAG: hypothetical protein A2968_00300 